MSGESLSMDILFILRSENLKKDNKILETKINIFFVLLKKWYHGMV